MPTEVIRPAAAAARERPLDLSVFGLGYVGSVSAACFSRCGHRVLGVDTSETKVAMINAGRSPVIEPGLEDIIARSVATGRLRATNEAEMGIADSDVSLVCVPTPSRANGSVETSYLETVCGQIGAALARKHQFHVVVIRSTILPGTLQSLVIPTLERASGKSAGVDFGVCVNPEFLREGLAIGDFMDPPKTVIGATDEVSGAVVERLYDGFPGPVVRCSADIAEMVKLTDNVWHAVKVVFGNEIGSICKVLGIDSHRLMDIFCMDRKLNLSPYYLKPAFAFGGSCLPKDLRAATYLARSRELPAALLAAVALANRDHLERGFDLIRKTGKRTIGFLGFSFKAGTDDLRESPLVELIERLVGKGYELRLYDPNVNLARLTGANLDYILKAIPHLERLMVGTIEEAVLHSEVIVIGHSNAEFVAARSLFAPEQTVIDLVRIPEIELEHPNYEGICW